MRIYEESKHIMKERIELFVSIGKSLGLTILVNKKDRHFITFLFRTKRGYRRVRYTKEFLCNSRIQDAEERLIKRVTKIKNKYNDLDISI